MYHTVISVLRLLLRNSCLIGMRIISYGIIILIGKKWSDNKKNEYHSKISLLLFELLFFMNSSSEVCLTPSILNLSFQQNILTRLD